MFDITKIESALQVVEIDNIMEVNDLTSNYGIVITYQQAGELVAVNQRTLQEIGRIGYGSDIIEELIIAFVDSPFINKYNYHEIFMELLEIFYYYKENLDQYCSDEEVIEYIKCAYDGPCQGSLDYLKEGLLKRIIDDIQSGKDILEEIKYEYWKD